MRDGLCVLLYAFYLCVLCLTCLFFNGIQLSLHLSATTVTKDSVSRRGRGLTFPCTTRRHAHRGCRSPDHTAFRAHCHPATAAFSKRNGQAAEAPCKFSPVYEQKKWGENLSEGRLGARAHRSGWKKVLEKWKLKNPQQLRCTATRLSTRTRCRAPCRPRGAHGCRGGGRRGARRRPLARQKPPPPPRPGRATGRHADSAGGDVAAVVLPAVAHQ